LQIVIWQRNKTSITLKDGEEVRILMDEGVTGHHVLDLPRPFSVSPEGLSQTGNERYGAWDRSSTTARGRTLLIPEQC